MDPYVDYAEIRSSEAVQLRWLSWPVLLLVLVLPGIIAFTVESQYRAGSILAYVNCVLIAWLMLHLLKRDPELGILPCVALPSLAAAWPATSLYFAIFHVPMTYNTFEANIPNLDGMLKVQEVVLVFLCAYIPVLLLFFHKNPREVGVPPTQPRRLVVLSSFLCMLVITTHDVTRLSLSESAPIVWVTHGLFNYCESVMLMIGALVQSMPVMLKLLLGIFIFLNMGFNMVGNARGYGFFPVLFFVSGYLLLSHVSQKRKMILVWILVLGFPVYVLVGNTTREVFGSSSFRNFGQRLDVLWRAAPSAGVSSTAFDATMGRLFMTGGHSIMTRSPDQVPFYDFNLGAYLAEMGRSLLPQILYFQPDYATNRHLIRYQLNVITSSIEISMVGHFWMLGGWIAVIIGGVATACLDGLVMELIRRARRVSWAKTYIYLSIFAGAMFETFSADYIMHFRYIVWRWMLAFILYQVVRVIVRDRDTESVPYSSAPSPYDALGYPIQ